MLEELHGKVNEFGEACVEISFTHTDKICRFLIDTGFNGSLCIPRKTAEELSLKVEEQTTFYGVGDHQAEIDIAYTEINWFSETAEVSVLVNEGEDFLLGTALLENKELYINFKTREVLISN